MSFGRDEQTLDRELDELTGELRTVIPGVTVLLAFLLGESAYHRLRGKPTTIPARQPFW